MVKRGFKYLLLLTGALLLAAYSSDENLDEAAEGERSTEETAGGTINIGMSEDMVTVDPHGSNDSASAQIRRNIYESLIFLDEALELTPGLATEWEATEDTVLNFKLRDAGGDEFQTVADEISEHIGTVTGAETDGTNHLQLADDSPAVYLNHASFLLGVNNGSVSNIGLDSVGNIRLENANFNTTE